MVRIEIVAYREGKVYSVGVIEVRKKGDVYHIPKILNDDFHTSRHADGTFHWKSKKSNFIHDLGKRIPIKNLKGVEFLGIQTFSTEGLSKIYNEYRFRKCDGIFVIDMKDYANGKLNMSIALLTKEGLPKLYDYWKEHNKRQICIFTSCNPMVAILMIEVTPQPKSQVLNDDMSKL